MSKRGRSKLRKPPNKKPKKSKWSFHRPVVVRNKPDARRVGKTTPKRAAGRWSFNDPSAVVPVKTDPFPDHPDIRHEIPLGEPWECKYGCTPFVWTQGQLHGHACPYWNNEGHTKTPF